MVSGVAFYPMRLGERVALCDHPPPCSEDAKKYFQPLGAVHPARIRQFRAFLAAALASSSSCSSNLPWAAPCKAPSSPSPISGSQPVHGRPPRQPPPTDRCCNGHSQCHHSGPSWPTEDIGTALESPRAKLHYPASLERKFGTGSCPAKLQARPLKGYPYMAAGLVRINLYRGYSKVWTHNALGPDGSSMPRSIGPS